MVGSRDVESLVVGVVRLHRDRSVTKQRLRVRVLSALLLTKERRDGDRSQDTDDKTTTRSSIRVKPFSS